MAPKRRYKETGKGSFFGDIVYDRVIPRTHFVVALENLIDWERYSELLIQLYEGRGVEGRPPYNPVLIMKMLFMAYLYNISERAVEDMVDYNLPVKWFVGLAVDEKAPDHSTLTKFKQRLLADGDDGALMAIFDDILFQATGQGIEMGHIQILDSTHTCAHVNRIKDLLWEEKGKPPRDPDARVVHKGRREVVDADGKTRKRNITHRGYKTHVSINAKTGLVTSLIPALGNTADNKAFAKLREHDRALGLPTRVYAGDRTYDDTDIFERLVQEGLHSGITLHDYRTKKRDSNKERWEKLIESEEHQRGQKARPGVEHPFGWVKAWEGFEVCRYLRLSRYSIQSIITFLVSNLKRIVKLLTGITFRKQAKGRHAEVFQPVYESPPWV